MDEIGQVGQQNGNENHESSSQNVEEILYLIEEARKTEEGPKVGGNFVGGTTDLDEIGDIDIDDIETSVDFVCAL